MISIYAMGNNISRRHHYIPQKYLEGFCDSDSKMWVYSKDQKDFQSNVINIGVEKDFYKISDNDLTSLEDFLSHKIENPANPILDKILKREKINDNEKFILANYAYSMIKRVPEGKKRSKKILPRISEPVLQEFYQLIEKTYSEEKWEPLKKEAERFIAHQCETPSNIFSKPNSPVVPAALIQMNWYFLCAPVKSYFLTCDNPFFFHESQGLGLEAGDFTFPISKHIALWGTNQTHRDDCAYHQAKLRTLREINRRTIKNATRYVYSSTSDTSIERMIRKRRIKIEIPLPL